jgi:ankyrin repeat protein
MSIFDDFDQFARRKTPNTPEYKLFQASSRGNFELVKQILNQVEPLNVNETVNGLNACHIAAKKGFSDILETILLKNTEFIYSRGIDGKTCEMIAAFEGKIEMLKVLHHVESQNNLSGHHIADDRGNTSLHHAAWAGQFECFKYLVEEMNRDPSVVNLDQIPPLQIAAAGNHSSIVEYLLSKTNADNDKPPENLKESVSLSGMNSLLRAASHGSLSTVRLLLEKNPSQIHVRAENGSTALHFAAKHGHREVVQFLLSFADSLASTLSSSSSTSSSSSSSFVNAQNEFQLTALHYAALEGYSDIVRLLLVHSADEDCSIKSATGETAFDLAVLSGRHEVARLFYQRQPTLVIREVLQKERSSGKSVLEKTVENGFKEMANTIVLWSFCQLRLEVCIQITFLLIFTVLYYYFYSFSFSSFVC